MHPSELWHGRGLGPRAARAALAPVSWLYALGWQTYLAAYQVGLKRSKKPHIPVVCVGALTVGGSGKTPFALHVADVMRGLGRDVVLGMSGYGGPAESGARLAPEGPLDAREWGDEPAMARLLRPDLPLVVGRRRVLAAELCARERPGAVLLMDDGFQHLPLRKHLNLILDDPAPDNARTLPAGPYREPRGNRRRADLVLPGEFRIEGGIVGLFRPNGTPHEPARAIAVCALGEPGGFLRGLAERGVEVAHAQLLPDHDPLDAGTLLERLPPDLPVVVTAKDWVKLRERPDAGSREFLIARHEVRAEPAGAFRDWLASRLDGRL